MNTKKLAFEILMKFYTLDDLEFDQAIACSLIAVNLIIGEVLSTTEKKYWLEVRQELIKMQQ